MPHEKHLIVAFMLEKDFLLFKVPGKHILTKDDIEDLRMFPPEVAANFFKSLRTRRFDNNCTNASLCPWCFLAHTMQPILYPFGDGGYEWKHLPDFEAPEESDYQCSLCPYGERNGQCGDYSSRYTKLMATARGFQGLGRKFIHWPGMATLVDKYTNLY